MAKYLDWYLVELERNLDTSMRSEEIHALLIQTEDHISMLTEELMGAGMDELRAEQAAVRRFGQLETLTGKSVVPPAKRTNWAAPALVILGSSLVLGSALWFGSVFSILVSSGLAIAALILSALLCCRKGAFPGLAFGILLLCCLTGLSGVAGAKLLGFQLEFARRSDAALLQQLILAKKPELDRRIHLYQLGLAYVEHGSARNVPLGLRDDDGIVCPGEVSFNLPRDQFYACGVGPNTIRNVLSQSFEYAHTNRSLDAYAQWKQALTPNTQPPMAYQRPSQYQELQQVIYWRHELDDALSALKTAPTYEMDNLFGGIAAGSAITLLWIVIAYILNRFANINWTMEPQPARHQRKLA